MTTDFDLAARDGLDRLLTILRARVRALAEPPPLPEALGPPSEFGDCWNPDDPKPGFYRTRLVKAGPWVPSCNFQTAAGEWRGWVDDELWPLGDRLLFMQAVTEVWFLGSHELRIAKIAAAEYDHWRLRTRTPIDMSAV